MKSLISLRKLYLSRSLGVGQNFKPLDSNDTSLSVSSRRDRFTTVFSPSVVSATVRVVSRIRLKEYFFNGDNVEGDFSNVPAFRNKSVWCPERGRELAIEAYAQAVEEEILSSIRNEGATYSNLSTSEREALKNLKSYNDIVIKEADKGSGVVVMDRDRYIKEAFRQLEDPNVYRETPVDITQHISKIVNDRIKKVCDEGYIDEKTLDYLLVNSNPRAGRFYLLPKIHKKGCPGRPVISGCGTSTEKISEFVDFNIKHLVPEIPSYVRDTKHFLRVLGEVGTLPEGAILVTADVVGLYPHIPHEEGLRILREALSRSTVTSSVPADHLVDLARLVLTSNNLSFNGEHYLQIRGTAIGTKMAPSYANVFMGGLETRLFEQAPVKPVFWRRFIDDVFFIWTDREESLKEFLALMNSFHDTIKFTFSWSDSQVNFLDVNVMLNNGVLATDLFCKPTDKHQYLFHTSCHPNSCKRGIPYGQALRIRRICSTDELFEKRAREFCGYLIKRGFFFFFFLFIYLLQYSTVQYNTLLTILHYISLAANYIQYLGYLPYFPYIISLFPSFFFCFFFV